MKIDAKVKCENNVLYFLDGRKCNLENAQVLHAEAFCRDVKNLCAKEKIFLITLPWTLCGMNEESYNEEFLAQLRDALKVLEENESYAVICPLCDGEANDQAAKEAFVAAMKHAARRIKDCENVVGFEIPENLPADFFVEELSAKHQQYVFFTDNAELLKNSAFVKL